jgi:hypothetical protein
MRDYKKEYREYHARPEQKRNRAARNLWNRRLKGRVPAGKEIDHKQPLVNGGSNTRANIRYRSVSANRGDKSHMKTAQRADGDTHEKRETRTTRNVMLGLSALGALGGGAYLLRNRRRASAPTWDNLGKGSVNTAPLDDKPSAGVLSVDTGDVSRHAPPSPASQGPRNLGEIVREQQRANAKVFQLTENNVLRAEDYDIKATLASDKRGYGEEVRHLHTIVGDSNIQTILRSPTGNKLIMLMRLKREGKLSPAGETALEDARRRLAEKYSILELQQIKEANMSFYNHLEKLAARRDAARDYENRRSDRRERKADVGHGLIALGGGAAGYGVNRHLQGSIDALGGKSFLGGIAGLPKARADLEITGADVGKYLSSRANRAKYLARLGGVGAGVGTTMLASRGYNSARDEYARTYGPK